MKKEICQEPESMIKLSQFFIKMSEFQKKYDHPILASDCFITAKTLLYWAKVALEEPKK